MTFKLPSQLTQFLASLAHMPANPQEFSLILPASYANTQALAATLTSHGISIQALYADIQALYIATLPQTLLDHPELLADVEEISLPQGIQLAPMPPAGHSSAWPV